MSESVAELGQAIIDLARLVAELDLPEDFSMAFYISDGKLSMKGRPSTAKATPKKTAPVPVDPEAGWRPSSQLLYSYKKKQQYTISPNTKLGRYVTRHKLTAEAVRTMIDSGHAPA